MKYLIIFTATCRELIIKTKVSLINDQRFNNKFYQAEIHNNNTRLAVV
jgi:hypothetical protein